MKDLKDGKYQLKALLRRNNVIAKVKDNWSKQHLRWLTELILPHPAQQIVLQEYIQTITERMNRLKRLDNELEHHVKNWRYYPVVIAEQGDYWSKEHTPIALPQTSPKSCNLDRKT